MKTKQTQDFLNRAFRTLPKIKKAFSLKMAGDMIRMNIAVPHIIILQKLAETQPKSIGSLGDELEISHAMMTHFVDQLEKKKMVIRQRSERDRRVVEILLTKKGDKMLKSVKELHRKGLEGFIGKFSKKDREDFIKSVDNLYRIMNKYGDNAGD